jgi:hypothetical protein
VNSKVAATDLIFKMLARAHTAIINAGVLLCVIDHDDHEHDRPATTITKGYHINTIQSGGAAGSLCSEFSLLIIAALAPKAQTSASNGRNEAILLTGIVVQQGHALEFTFFAFCEHLNTRVCYSGQKGQAGSLNLMTRTYSNVSSN